MSSFNWFSRSYEETSAEQTDTAEEAAKETTEGAKPTATSADDKPLSAEDYLKWAKTAYQNIQERQQETAPPVAETAAQAKVETVPTETTPAAAEVESVSEDPVSEDPVPEDPVSEESVTAEPVPEEPTITAATEVPTPPSESGISAAEAITAPFWAKAEAEREARLERLKETAIAAPEPEPATEKKEESPLELPDIDFDDAFVWSAEVLASQGRRPDQISVEEITWLNKLRQGLGKTRRGLVNQLKSIVGQGPLNEDAVFEIEALLLQADVGVAATDHIIEALQTRLREEVLPPDQAIAYLKSLLRTMLDEPLGGEHNLLFVPENDKLNIWMMTGVNGAGKTTTIGKLAHVAKNSGYRCLIAAADTFRAAAVEQVKVWGQRSDVDVIANPGQNTDPAAVVYDAISAALSRDTELLLIDTAGRLQNKKNLMDELAKVRRIIDKKAADANVEALLVLDATLGQNGIRQAQVFAEAANLSGVVLTKLDGTARGGVALAVVQQLGLPIRFIGAGEGIEDLRPFSSYEFVEALLSG
ncbi:MAG: signal recognition particle-docking protein FtsY [Cyanobacteria bacterium P01_D01_bin.44]